MSNGVASMSPAVVLEDDWLLVVDKPSGLATQAGKHDTDTLEGWARAYLGPAATRNGFTVGAAHRLDRETSGLVVLAKRRPAMQGFSKALSERRVRKAYLALVKGMPAKPKETLRTPLVDLHGAGGVPQEASTRYELLASNGTASLVRCFPETGRLHQIRRHFAGVRHPIAGDTKYGDEAFDRRANAEWGLTRLFLHAASLSFPHPRDGAKVMLEAPLPPDLQPVLARAGLEGKP
jgi:23S rRNA pseudouridine955/2504/2580 synthase